MKPYYQDDAITLYCGDMRDILPALSLTADAIVTDPPYGQTPLEWDIWPDGWVKAALSVAPQLWCFGSFRMFLERRDDFSEWNYAQEIIWEKHNGSGFMNDRFRRVHELAVHFYRGKWSDLYNNTPIIAGGYESPKRVAGPPHQRQIGKYAAQDKEGRLQRSVISVRSCHGYAIHPTQKPEGIVRPLLQCSVPPRGLVLDCFASSGTTLAVARELGMKAVGIEGKEEFCAKIVDRLSQSGFQFTS